MQKQGLIYITFYIIWRKKYVDLHRNIKEYVKIQ